mgnify:CR=1 FL=1
MVIVYFDTSLLEYESEPGIPPYFLRLVGPIQLYLHWSQKTLVHIADAYPCHINRFGRVKNLMKLPRSFAHNCPSPDIYWFSRYAV